MCACVLMCVYECVCPRQLQTSALPVPLCWPAPLQSPLPASPLPGTSEEIASWEEAGLSKLPGCAASQSPPGTLSRPPPGSRTNPGTPSWGDSPPECPGDIAPDCCSCFSRPVLATQCAQDRPWPEKASPTLGVSMPNNLLGSGDHVGVRAEATVSPKLLPPATT